MHRSVSIPLLFALTACPGDDGTAESGGSGEDSGTTAGTGQATAAESTGGTAPATSDGTTSGETMPGDSGSTGGAADPTAACLASCDVLVECGVVDVPNCGIPCASIPGMVAGCEAEYVALHECIAALSCEDAMAWNDAMGVGTSYPCAAEDGTYQACIAPGGSGG